MTSEYKFLVIGSNQTLQIVEVEEKNRPEVGSWAEKHCLLGRTPEEACTKMTEHLKSIIDFNKQQISTMNGMFNDVSKLVRGFYC